MPEFMNFIMGLSVALLPTVIVLWAVVHGQQSRNQRDLERRLNNSLIELANAYEVSEDLKQERISLQNQLRRQQTTTEKEQHLREEWAVKFLNHYVSSLEEHLNRENIDKLQSRLEVFLSTASTWGVEFTQVHMTTAKNRLSESCQLFLKKEAAKKQAKTIKPVEPIDRKQTPIEKTGYLYVISNVGSFGEDVFLIGTTDRLEPMDVVRQLGEEAVPFSFDVQMVIHSSDVQGLENQIQRELQDCRVNKRDYSKNFFKTSLSGISDAISRFQRNVGSATKMDEGSKRLQFLNSSQSFFKTAA